MRTSFKWVSVLLTLLVLFIGQSSAQLPDTLAVVPFQVIGKTEIPDIYRLGFPDDLACSLSQYQDITIVSRIKLADILQELKLSQTGLFGSSDIQRVGHLLPADGIVTGTVYISGNSLRIYVHLIDVRTGELLIDMAEKGKIKKPEQIFAFQDKISKQFADRLKLQPVSGYQKRIRPVMRSYQHYILALSHLYGGDVEKARQESAWALKIDPAFSQAQSFEEELENAFQEMDNVIDEMKKKE